MNSKDFLLILLIVATFDASSSKKLKFCVVQSTHNFKMIDRYCAKLQSDAASRVECSIVNDRFNCLRRLNAGDSDFAVLEPEDLVSSNLAPESDIFITHELRFYETDSSRFEMVALVSKNVEYLPDLKGKRICHPGFDTVSIDWTRVFANYLQDWIIPKKCDAKMTLIENDISSLSEYFQSGCIPGSWTFDTHFDSQLKSSYRNLCELCDNPNGCFADDKYHGFIGALLCLTDNVGDIAWVRLADVTSHFESEKINKNDYNFLCPDGMSRPVSSGRPCIWITKPWPVIASKRLTAETVSQLISSLNDRKFPWQVNLLELLEPYHVTPVAVNVLKSPQDFIYEFSGFASANIKASCKPSRQIRWCVSSILEELKCQTIRDVSFAFGIYPKISCHLQSGVEKSLNAVKNHLCDLFVVKADDISLDHLEEKSLVNFLQVIPKRLEDFYSVGILVKENSNFHTIHDLKGTRACFSSHNRIGWNAFRAVMKNQIEDDSWLCNDDKAFKSFFKEISFFEENNSDEYNCLTSGDADVAFVRVISSALLKEKKLKRICVSPAESKDECVLVRSSLASIVVSISQSELRLNEIYSVFMQLNSYFASKFIGSTPAFSLYGSYDEHPGVIFPEKSNNLLKDVNYVSLPRNYMNILKQINNQTICNGSTNHLHSNITLYYLLITFITMFTLK